MTEYIGCIKPDKTAKFKKTAEPLYKAEITKFQ